MANFKIVISDPKKGKSMQKEARDDAAQPFIGMKIGDKFKGELLDLAGYEFQITGGSDFAGFPMRKDVPGTVRNKILGVKGVGITNKKKHKKKTVKGLRTMDGMRQRVTMAGNTVFDKTAQINVKILKEGSAKLEFVDKPKEAKPAEAK